MKDKPKILIYTAVGGGILEYCELPRLLHKSLRLHHDKASVDFAVICPDQHWSELNIDEIHLNPHGSNPVFDDTFPVKSEDPMFWAAANLTIQKFKIFHNYDIILYLDADIIICKPLDEIFDLVQTNKFHVRSEGDLYNSVKTFPHRLPEYRRNTETRVLKTLERDNIQTFNSGQFMFKPTNRIENALNKSHDNWVNEYIKHPPVSSDSGKIKIMLSEQPYLNEQFIFNNTAMLEYEALGNNVPGADNHPVNPTKVVLHNADGWQKAISESKRLCNKPWWKGHREYKLKRLPYLWHFTAQDWQTKLQRMRDCYKYIKPLYQ